MKQRVAELLINIGAVALKPNEPFTWTSGMKSPIYCDNRLTMSHPKIRKEIAHGLQALIVEHFPEVEVIAGTATAGIPHAAWVSDLLEKPMCYVRSSAKAHGKGNQIEGKVEVGDKVVIIEDLISTGGSVITAAEALREAGCHVLGVVSIFTYELEKGKALLEDANVVSYSLTNFQSLVAAVSEKGNLTTEEQESLFKWRQDPIEWDRSFQEQK